MKLYITTIAIAALATNTISAPAVSFGTGMNASTITGSDTLVSSSSLLMGYTLNVGFEQNISKHFTLRTGISLESRGEGNNISIVHDATFSEERKEVLDILNLQIPVLAQFDIPLGDFGFNVFGGPELGVFLSGERRSVNTSYFAASEGNPARSAVDPDTTDFSRDMKMLDAGLRVGFGLEYKTGNIGSFFLRPSAYIGLIDILQTGHGKEKNANLNGNHQAFSIALGYKFNINPKMSNAATYKSTPVSEKKSPGVDKEEPEYNPENYKSDSSSQGGSSESEPASEVNDQE